MVMDAVDQILELLAGKGTAQYGGERVSQAEHALQCAACAEREGAEASLVAAALLHDLGHLLYSKVLPEGEERDDRHEHIAAGRLSRLFGADVTEPIRLHVDAKRWLSANEPGYFELLSPASVASLELQGGPFNAAESAAFVERPYAERAIRLRRWDDLGKVPHAPTRRIAEYGDLLRSVMRR
jgi:phosphonate degradation associated HDIG domain protein